VKNIHLLILTAATTLLAACSGGGAAGTVPSGGGGGGGGGPQALSTAVLGGTAGFIAPNGFTVYVFDADLNKANASACNGTCSQVWPPLAPPSGLQIASPWGTFARGDGKQQLSFSGHALYTYSGDTAPGQFNGDGITAFGATWHVARPSGNGGGSSGGGY